jgi:hypothetical protein
MSNSTFLSNENMNLLWEVLMENKIFLNKPKDFFIKINKIFNENIQEFYQQEIKNNPSISLININKKFITLLLSHIQNTILTNPNPNPNPILKEDIQNSRISKFEKNLHEMKTEFTNAMSIPVPPIPEFKDKIEEPLSDLEIEIKKTIAQRNYDIEKYPPKQNINDSSWLIAQETSIKNEKLKLTNDSKHYLSIDSKNLDNNFLKKEIIELPKDDPFNQKKEKHISWAINEKEFPKNNFVNQGNREDREDREDRKDGEDRKLEEGELEEEESFLKHIKKIPSSSSEDYKNNTLKEFEFDLKEVVKGLDSRLLKMELLIEKLIINQDQKQ